MSFTVNSQLPALQGFTESIRRDGSTDKSAKCWASLFGDNALDSSLFVVGGYYKLMTTRVGVENNTKHHWVFQQRYSIYRDLSWLASVGGDTR
jgi:hypothetical protein